MEVIAAEFDTVLPAIDQDIVVDFKMRVMAKDKTRRVSHGVVKARR